jgi:hypothetical protein
MELLFRSAARGPKRTAHHVESAKKKTGRTFGASGCDHEGLIVQNGLLQDDHLSGCAQFARFQFVIIYTGAEPGCLNCCFVRAGFLAFPNDVADEASHHIEERKLYVPFRRYRIGNHR